MTDTPGQRVESSVGGTIKASAAGDGAIKRPTMKIIGRFALCILYKMQIA
jgi:hypothetical protein